MKQQILIVHNIRSTYNVGSLLRTAEGLGIKQVYLTGYTPYPISLKEERLPHLAKKIDAQIRKTSLGAELMVSWEHIDSISTCIKLVRAEGYTITALEQAKNSVSLPEYRTPPKLALLVGREVDGIELEVLALCDSIVEIPMLGKKESFNVAQAAAMAMYHVRFIG